MTKTSDIRICVPVGARLFDDLPALIGRASRIAEIVELRLDYLDDSELGLVPARLDEILRSTARPLIFTYRPLEEGGLSSARTEERVSFWSGIVERVRAKGELFIDLELELLESHPQICERALLNGWKIICSHHDFEGVPRELDRISKRMLQLPFPILKIAVRANDITDCIAVFNLIDGVRDAGRDIIAMAMGENGLVTRILAPSRGAFLTFGSLAEGFSTAPGQVGAKEMRDLYRINSITELTQIMGIVGLPVAHSISPHMHNVAFAARGVDAVYMPLEVQDVEEFVRRMAHPRTREMDWNLRGFSVTAPHKTRIMQHLDWIDAASKEIGAVNTVVVRGEELHGYNTDGAAVLAGLNGRVNVGGARVGVIGAGGAARALLWSLKQRGASTTVFARDESKARETVAAFGAKASPLEGAQFEEFDVVVNATPLGTRGKLEAESPVKATQLRGTKVVYDLVYNPRETRFMTEGRIAGCEAYGGLPMLVAQAAEQFKLWTDLVAPIDVMNEAATGALTS
jgi:3-dehydroquinate dehydratase/shikimate dehydrogenase